MADSRDRDDAGASGSQPSIPSAEDFQRLADRVAAQGQQLADFIALVTSRLALPKTSTRHKELLTTIVPIVVPTVPATPMIATPAAETAPIPFSTPPSTDSTEVVQLVKDFIRLKPVYFDDQREFEKVEKWVLSQEKLHRVLQIDDRLRAEISSYTLQRDVDVWWRATIAAEGEFESWDAFKTKFYQQYFPPAVMKRLRKEFMNIRQGADETVMRYRDRYGYLKQFAGDLVKEDADEVYYFGDGLRPDIGFYLASSGAKTLGEIFERALAHETYYMSRVADGTPLVPAMTPDQMAEYERRRRRGKGPRRWDRGVQGAIVPYVAPPTPLQTIVGRPPIPPPVRPALPAPTTSTLPALPAPPASRQQHGGRG
ncbi:hypothetical protein Syun_021080 [Stephania yunnanensis]|uniref:Retrotransposon gag domain-containing protein n=1 Tax=Stephania yunnanensis TaxID=152371 RepID=A0AAP0IF52_9MAGN